MCELHMLLGSFLSNNNNLTDLHPYPLPLTANIESRVSITLLQHVYWCGRNEAPRRLTGRSPPSTRLPASASCASARGSSLDHLGLTERLLTAHSKLISHGINQSTITSRKHPAPRTSPVPRRWSAPSVSTTSARSLRLHLVISPCPTLGDAITLPITS